MSGSSDNTIDIILRLRADEFERGLKSEGGRYNATLAGMRRAAEGEAGRLKQAWDPKRILGVRDTQAEIAKINAAYRQLSREGVISAKQLAAARKQSIAALKGEATAAHNLTGNIVRLAAAYLSVRTFTAALRQLLTVGGDFERLRAQLAGLTGSAEAGKQAFAWINKFVTDTPYGLQEVTKGFVALKAYGLDPIDGSYQAIADEAALLGGSQETLQGIILGVGQAWAKQKLQGQEILQLVNQGVPVWDLLAKATGKNVQELQKLSEQGKLGRDVIRALIEEMGKGAQGEALRQVQTWNGVVSNAIIEWQKFLDEIGRSGVLDSFKQELQDLIDKVEQMAQTGELQQYAKDVAQGIVLVATALKDIAGVIVHFRQELGLIAGFLITKKIFDFVKGIEIIAPAAAGSAGALSKMSQAMLAASATAPKLAAGLKGIFAVLRVGGVLILFQEVTFAIEKIIKLYDLYKENLDIQAQADRYKAGQQKIIDSTAEFRGETVKTKEELKKLSAAELIAYRDRLQSAQRYYAAKRDLQSRQDAEQNGPLAPVSQEALAYAKEARIRAEALRSLGDALHSRQVVETEFATKLRDAREKETANIKAELAKQVQAYEDANNKLKAARDQRKAIADSFKKLIEDINAAPAKAAQDLTVIDPITAIDQARGAFQSGDFQQALKAAEVAREQIRALNEQGKSTKYYLTQLAQQAAEVADQASAGQIGQQQQAVDAIKAKMDELVAKAEFLKHIQIGYDAESAVQSTEELRQRLQRKLDQNPLVMPVKLGQDKYGRAADQILQDNAQPRAWGGLLHGSGTSTSDSILMLGSTGEYVVRAAAVRAYGVDFLNAVNAMKLPGFAAGGLVSSLPSVGAAPGVSPLTGTAGTPVHLHLGGQDFALSGPPDTVAELQLAFRRQARKTGRPRP